MKEFSQIGILGKINDYHKGMFLSEKAKIKWANETICQYSKEKIYMFREAIPKAQRTIIERLEYWLVNHGIKTQMMWFKWNNTLIEDYIESIDLDVKDVVLKDK